MEVAEKVQSVIPTQINPSEFIHHSKQNILHEVGFENRERFEKSIYGRMINVAQTAASIISKESAEKYEIEGSFDTTTPNQSNPNSPEVLRFEFGDQIVIHIDKNYRVAMTGRKWTGHTGSRELGNYREEVGYDSLLRSRGQPEIVDSADLDKRAGEVVAVFECDYKARREKSTSVAEQGAFNWVRDRHGELVKKTAKVHGGEHQMNFSRVEDIVALLEGYYASVVSELRSLHPTIPESPLGKIEEIRGKPYYISLERELGKMGYRV